MEKKDRIQGSVERQELDPVVVEAGENRLCIICNKE